MKSYEDMVREVESVKDTEAELEGLVPVRARVSPNLGVVYSLRLSRDEMNRISEAASKRGKKISEFLRMAALAAAEEDSNLGQEERASVLQSAREKAQDLAETLNQL